MGRLSQKVLRIKPKHPILNDINPTCRSKQREIYTTEFQRNQRKTDWPGRLPTKREAVENEGLKFTFQWLCGLESIRA